MIRFYEILYYCTLQFYYKDGNFKNDHPYYTAFMLHVGAFCMQLIFVKALFMVILHGRIRGFKGTVIEKVGIASIAFILAYLLFVRKQKHFDIYKKYKDVALYRRVQIKILTIGYLVLSYLSPILFAIGQNYYFDGRFSI